MRKDHLPISDRRRGILDLRWDYSIPYQMDDLSGVDVTPQDRPGRQPAGRDGGGQSVEAWPHEVIADFWGPDGERQANLFCKAPLLYLRHGLFRGQISPGFPPKTPTPSSSTLTPRLDFMLYRPKPYWYSLESQNAVMGGFVPQFCFPALLR